MEGYLQQRKRTSLFFTAMTSAFGMFVSTCAWLIAINIFSSWYFLWAQNPFMCSSSLCLAFSGLPVMMVMHEKKVESTKMLNCVGFISDEVLILEGKRQSNYESALFRHLKMIMEELQQNPFSSVEWAADLLSVFARHPSQQFNILKCRKEKISIIFQKRRPRGEITHACTIERNV